jgi:hypothetical protein
VAVAGSADGALGALLVDRAARHRGVERRSAIGRV